MRADQRPWAGLVQQTVQIVASHDITLVVQTVQIVASHDLTLVVRPLLHTRCSREAICSNALGRCLAFQATTNAVPISSGCLEVVSTS